MTIRRLLYATVGMVFVGGIIATLWVYFTNRTEFLAGLLQVHPSYIIILVFITVYYAFMRFIRWQFLLRRANIRLPARPSLSIYLASLVGTATPAYIGEIIRSLLIRQKFGIPIRITVVVLIGERILDVVALAFISLITVNTWWMRATMLIFILVAALVGILVAIVAREFDVPPSVLVQLNRANNLIPAFCLSLAIWLPAALLITLTATSLNISIPPITGIRIFSTATIFGGMTLMPAGVGSTGSLAILQLQAFGISLTSSVFIISLIRFVTVSLIITSGIIFLISELVALKYAKENDSVIHFDEIASEYSEQFSEHIWDHLLERKTKFMTDALPNPSIAGIGLDLGCGLGQQCVAMKKRGYRVIGIDLAQNLVRQAHRTGITSAIGNALKLPFKERSLDFVYTVGVLHHLPGVKAQNLTYHEVARVLKPGGIFIIHETNPRNPLFRFYMGYIFPLLKSIDEGIEWWIEPHYWKEKKGMKLVKLHYFTFLPDFIPQFLMNTLLALQWRLEASWLRPYSVHYMAVVQKDPIETSKHTAHSSKYIIVRGYF